MSEKIWHCNLKHSDVKRVFPEDNYWVKVLTDWCELNYCEPEGVQNILKQLLWYNSNLLIDNKPYFIDKAYDEGIMYIKDLIDPESNQIRIDELNIKYSACRMV